MLWIAERSLTLGKHSPQFPPKFELYHYHLFIFAHPPPPHLRTPTYPPPYLPTSPPTHPPTYPPIHLSTYPPIHLLIHPSGSHLCSTGSNSFDLVRYKKIRSISIIETPIPAEGTESQASSSEKEEANAEESDAGESTQGEPGTDEDPKDTYEDYYILLQSS